MAGEASLLSRAFRVQSSICMRQGAPFYADLLERAAQDVEEDGAVARVVAGWPGDPVRDWIALRVMAGVHQLVLAGGLDELAAHYPTAGGRPTWPDAWRLFRAAVEERADEVRGWLANTPQTNEVGRSATLLGGFHRVSRAFGLPLRLRELGASAGLNLCWDRYRYELGPVSWGDASSPVTLRAEWSGPKPELVERVAIESRRGCDLAPIHLVEPGAAARLEAYVWADQPERLDRLRRAIAVARADPPEIDRSAAGTWLAKQLRALPTGAATVVYHSSFWAYLSREERGEIQGCMAEAGARATREAPLAWLRLEDVAEGVELRLRTWPDGADLYLAVAQVHGRWIRWLEPTTRAPSADGSRS